LIQPKAWINQATLNNFHRMRKAEVLRTFDGSDACKFSACPRRDGDQSHRQYQRSGLVEFAEPDYLVYANATVPNDPNLWTGHCGG